MTCVNHTEHRDHWDNQRAGKVDNKSHEKGDSIEIGAAQKYKGKNVNHEEYQSMTQKRVYYASHVTGVVSLTQKEKFSNCSLGIQHQVVVEEMAERHDSVMPITTGATLTVVKK